MTPGDGLGPAARRLQCDPTSDAETFASAPVSTRTSSVQGMKPLVRTVSRWSPGASRKLHGVLQRATPSAKTSTPVGWSSTETVPASGPASGGLAGGGAGARVQARTSHAAATSVDEVGEPIFTWHP